MIVVTDQTIRAALLEFLQEFWSLDHDGALKLATRSLKVKSEEVTAEIRRTAITAHPLYPILIYVLEDVIDHAGAIDVIGKNRATLLHVRHIEEVYTISKYLLSCNDRYQEFAWRWSSFKTLHAIRNRILNLKQPLDPAMTTWIEENLDKMKQFFSKKFEIDPAKCLDQWEKLSNWLYKIPLNEVFEKSDRKESYVSAAYDWNSQAVHLSPLGDAYMGYELKHHDYGDFALQSALVHLHKICHECIAIVEDQSGLRKYYLLQVLLDTYELLCIRPAHYMELANKGGQYSALTNLLLQKPFDFNAVMNVSISAPPKDLLLFEFPTTGALSADSPQT